MKVDRVSGKPSSKCTPKIDLTIPGPLDFLAKHVLVSSSGKSWRRFAFGFI
jgi:hypothetical protein